MSLRTFVAVLLFIALMGPQAPIGSAADFTQQVVDLTNAERVKQGLSPLAVSGSLSASAQAYASAMAAKGFFGHVAPDGSTMAQRNSAAGYINWSYLAENIAAGQRTPSDVVAAWLNSPEHRANLLSPRVREIGVGNVFVDGSPFGSYWVQELGNTVDGAAPVVASPPSSDQNASIAQSGRSASGSRLDHPGSAEPATLSPVAPSGVGHSVANIAPSGQAESTNGFSDGYGGIDSYGYSMEAPTARNDRWPQLGLLGGEYISARDLSLR